MELNRRDFLKLLGVSAAGASVGVLGAGTLFSVPDRVFQRLNEGPKIETWKSSVCNLCPGNCGIMVRLIDDIPVKVIGNPLHPVNHGAICPMAEGAIELLFHPQRVRQPLKRVAERGANQWQAISWQEAVDTLKKRLAKLKAEATPEKLVVLSNNSSALFQNNLQEIMNGFGSPNLYFEDDLEPGALPVQVAQGLNQIPAYDIQNTDCLLNFGADLLDEGPSPIRHNQLYTAIRNRADGASADIYHFSSKMTRTAARSKKWVPVIPGTMASVALSIAAVMIRDRSYHKGFIKDHCFGFKDWQDARGNMHPGFESLVSSRYYPERVSEISGVPAETIVQLAREFAAADKALAIFGDDAISSTNGFYTAWSIYCLNALKGNLNKPGGVLFSEPMLKRVEQAQNLAPALGGQNMYHTNAFARLIENMSAKKPYGTDTLFLNRINPLFTMPDRAGWHRAFQNSSFIVSYTTFIDDSSLFADLVLPAPFFLENLDVLTTAPGMEINHLSVQQPVVEPLYETRPLIDVLRECTQVELASKNYQAAVKQYVSEVYASGRGAIISESTDRSWIEFLKERGWQPFAYSTFDEFWQVLLEKGGWWDPIHQKHTQIFHTKSGRFEFYSQDLLAHWQSLNKDSEMVDIASRPHYTEIKLVADKANFPLQLIIYSSLANHGGQGSYSGLLQEVSAVFSREFWNSWAEINPATATQYGLRTGDNVALISSVGRAQLKLKTDPTVMPGVVAVPFGQGHAAGILDKQKIGENPMDLLRPDSDPISGNWSHVTTRVRIEKTSSVTSS